MLVRHHNHIAHTSDTSALSEQFSLPVWEREQVEAKGYGSFLELYSAFLPFSELGQLLLSVHSAWSFQPATLSQLQ